MPALTQSSLDRWNASLVAGNTLNALIKVIAPTLYAWLFAFGSSHGVLGLPFYSTSALMFLSAAIAASIPAGMWTQSSPRRKSA